MTVDPLGTFRDDLIAGASQARPARRRRHQLMAVATAAALMAVAVRVQPTEGFGRDEEVVTGEQSSTAPPIAKDGVPPSGPVWSIASPPGWRRAGPELFPDLSPTSVTLATIALSDAGGGPCPDVPTNALRRLGPEDALLSVVFDGPGAGDAPAWPDSGFDDDAFPVTGGSDIAACDIPADLEIHRGAWSRGGHDFRILVSFGPDVTTDQRETAWTTLSSLRPNDGEAAGPPVCVVTRAAEPGLRVPDGWPARPSSGAWYGSAELWTVLPTDGSSPTPRKSVWWSQRFLGGAREPTPEVVVTWERLDDPAPTVQEVGGTNAHTPEEGWFMIGGIDPPTAGCWSVTASYRSSNLSYVYWSEPGLWADATPTDEGDGALLEGTVHFDDDHNCVVIEGDAGQHDPVVWPAGTTIADDGSIALADGSQISIGQRVQGGGGYQPTEPYLRLAPQGCMPDADEVFVMWTVAPAR